MGIADDPDTDDYYTKARGFPITYSPDEDPEVIEEMRIAQAELKNGGDESEDEDMEGAGGEGSSEDDTTSGEDGEVGAEDWVDEGSDEESSAGQSKRKRKVLSSVDKVRKIQYIILLILTKTRTQLHAVIVDILRSEVKRKKFRRLTRKLCAPKNRHLVPIRSMKIRWNTTFAEVLRGLELKPVRPRMFVKLLPH
jgi:hypothetical protein